MSVVQIAQKIGQQSKPWRFLASRILWHSGLSPLLTIPRDSYRLRFYPTAYSATMWLDSEAGRLDEAVFKTLLKPGDIVVDVGSNIGSLTLTAAALVGPGGKVFSIEAHPATYRYLVGNLKLNGASNVVSFNVACGEESRTVHFSDEKSDDQNAISTDGMQVQMRRIDELITIPPERQISLLKIDVEGYEKYVLEGAIGLLGRTDAVYFESWEEHFRKYGYELGEIIDLLHDHGFTIQRASGEIVNRNYRSLQCENLLATRTKAKA